ncbi:General transcription factor IIE subunit 1 [Trichinella papuae]|uniref:General transcription factor IIE subunit 1 n=1 Tax=Trichinella papuae TaxID=268474 RepID=A0A0V1N2P5_9BILA|nr:General transcription factor IIE subunit 1 [Trichinella papuae]
MSKGEVRLLDEIPDSMLRLTRMITRAFYGPECGLIIDMLIRNVSMREEELRDLLKFDPKQLRVFLLSLKTDKIIKERQELEPRPEGRPLRFNYYYICYPSFITMIKYKLENMRKRLESQQKSVTNRSSFKCTSCDKLYSDLDIKENELPTEVELSRSGLAKFNEQLWPVFEILRSLQGVQLARHLLEPEPPSKLRQARENSSKRIDLTARQRGFEMGSSSTETANTLIITDSKAGSKIVQKEIPAWLQNSTIRGSAAGLPDISAGQQNVSVQPVDRGDDIVKKLLVHESRSNFSFPSSSSFSAFAVQDQTNANDEEDSDDEFVEEEEELKVTVQGRPITLEELMSNPSLVNTMTEEEKQNYVRITQQAFSNYYVD